MEQISASLPPYFNPLSLREELTSLWRENPDNPGQVRLRVLHRLKELKQAARVEAAALLHRTGSGRACASALSLFQDDFIKLICDFAVTHLFRAGNPSAAEHMAIVATGGYGRGMLAPGSDIDLLFLLPYKQTAWGESVVEAVLYFLWDLGYKVGHATRTIDQTIKAAESDLTIRTALLDSRLVHGEKTLFNEMQSRYVSGVVRGGQREFIVAKLDEREQRLRKAGLSRYRVEPNVKEGKGGLRDLNMLHWFSAYLNPSRESQPEQSIFSAEELATYRRCEDFLWTIRCNLHFLANKAEERLSFDMQPEMAKRLRYKDRGGLLGVERFMKHYFLIAKDVGDLTRIVCSGLELRQLKTVPTLSDFIGAFPWSSRAKLAATTAFRIDNSRLNVKEDDVFRKDKSNLIRLFTEAERNNVLLHPHAIRLVRGSLHLIDEEFRRDPEANRLFLDLLTSSEVPESSLRAMNETGILGRFIPEFGRIVAMMQFNMYHHFTIDEHLLRAIGILSRIEKGELESELPLSTEIIRDIQNRRALYVALLVHDVAKGLEEDHSIVGARIARALARRMGLSEGEADTAGWLVEQHLTMSQFAQSRDVSDPQTIRQFADIVQSPERLKLLLLLTVADIRAVGPGIWNGWKGQLLRSLYYDTEPLLAGGHTKLPRTTRIEEAKLTLRSRLSGWTDDEVGEFIARHEPEYWLSTTAGRQAQHARLIRQLEAESLPLAFDVVSDAFTGRTELTLVTRDDSRLLMLFTGACAAAGVSIVSAQISTTKDGLALDTLDLARTSSHDAEEVDQAQRIARTIGGALAGKRSLSSFETPSQKPKQRMSAFTVPPDVVFDNTASSEKTVIEVHALDRPGLLFDLSRSLSNSGVSISSAHIATFGEKAVDVFYVTGPDKAKVTGDDAKSRLRESLLAAVAGSPVS